MICINAVKAAASDPDKVHPWIMAVRQLPRKELGVPEEFLTLDHKLKAELLRLASGQLLQEIYVKEEKAIKTNKFYRGRQVLYDVIKWVSASSSAQSLHDLEDLIAVKLQGNKLARFKMMWDFV